MKLLVGGECFYMQAAGGVSRIFQKVLPLLDRMTTIEEVNVYRDRPPPARQDIEAMQIRQSGVWLRRDRWPYRVRKFINTKFCQPYNDAYFQRSKASVYLPTYYSIPPRGVPSICFVYDMTYERHPESFAGMDAVATCAEKKKAIKAASRCLCISQQTKRDLMNIYNVADDQCDVVYLGGGERKAEPDKLTAQLPNVAKVLYVGNWASAYKNFNFMLSGLKMHQQHSSQLLELHVVSRYRSSVEERQRHYDLAGIDIVYHEAASDDELDKLYSESHVFVYPSLWEGFGIPIVEAMSWGCAVVCSDIPVFHEVGGDAVDYFDPQDLDSFCIAMKQAIGSGRSLDAVKKRTERAALFTWEKCAQAMLASIYKTVK